MFFGSPRHFSRPTPPFRAPSALAPAVALCVSQNSRPGAPLGRANGCPLPRKGYLLRRNVYPLPRKSYQQDALFAGHRVELSPFNGVEFFAGGRVELLRVDEDCRNRPVSPTPSYFVAQTLDVRPRTGGLPANSRRICTYTSLMRNLSRMNTCANTARGGDLLATSQNLSAARLTPSNSVFHYTSQRSDPMSLRRSRRAYATACGSTVGFSV